MTPDLWRPHRSGTFQPDGSGIRRNSGNPYCLWEANYKRHSPEEARQRVRRWLQDFAGAFEAAVLLCWNEAEQVWALEFEVRSPDYDSLLPDELDRGQGLQYLRMARECVNCRTKNESYLQSDRPYIVWPPERSVEYIPLAMRDLFDGFWYEIAANDEQRRHDATLTFIINLFDLFEHLNNRGCHFACDMQLNVWPWVLGCVYEWPIKRKLTSYILCRFVWNVEWLITLSAKVGSLPKLLNYASSCSSVLLVKKFKPMRVAVMSFYCWVYQVEDRRSDGGGPW